ncbi:Zn-ribbon domain-containing OB-fold protein [Nocardioides sp. W7]|uniref:Zn-ribbon domain-containing OB-fold protein n=1 Tax=Nocardioides sp. W7 TaxID=2931390 RepID=UPI001FD2BD24|nr:Zn-ribbon domain-containing OB-fold protein [Nocardioides sp. W7]
MSGPTTEPVTVLGSQYKVDYTYVAGAGRSRFLGGLAEGRLLARRCPSCGQVYLPAPSFCSRCLTGLDEPFEVSGRGRIATYCVVNFPFPGQTETPPYVVAYIRLDGVDTRLMHRISGIEQDRVAIDLEVEPVWVEPDQLAATLDSIRYFRPVRKEDDHA